jgi:hypothetical protein
MAKITGTQTLPAVLEPRTGTPSPRLAENEFRRVLSRFQDPVFSGLRPELDKIAAAALVAYSNSEKHLTRARLALHSRIPITTCPSIGSRRATQFMLRKSVTRILGGPRASC